jgi:hypothetical protein
MNNTRLVPLVAALAMGWAALCGAPRGACAEEPAKADAAKADTARADALGAAALARARQGERRVAIDLYEEAYAAARQPEYLRQIGALYDTLAHGGDARDVRLAILYLERYLAEAGQTPERPAVEERLRRLHAWKAGMRAEPQPPPPGPTPVHLFAYDHEKRYDVAVGNQGCTTPCTVLLPPGLAELKATGPGNVSLHLAVPPRPSQIRLQHADASSYTAGVVLVPVGLAVGAGMWALGIACGNDGGCFIANVVIWPVSGFAMLVTGITLLARGKLTPPPDANRIEIIAGRSPVRLSSFGLAPRPGGGAGALTLEF